MRKLIILACLCAGMAHSQTTPSSLLITRIFNITSTWPGECAAGVIDNRSMFTRQNNYHSFFATGTGTWSVTMQFSDVSCSGPFTSYGAQAVINQGTALAIGYGNDVGTSYHPFITFAFSGANANTVQVTYSAVQNFFLSTSTGALSFPLTVSQGGTGFSTCTANGFLYGNGTSALQCLTAGSQYQVAQAGAAGVPTMGALQLAQPAAITGNLPAANGGTGASSPAAHTVAVAEGASPFAFAGPGSAGQPFVSNGAAADPTYQTLPISGGGTGQTTQSAALTALLGSSIVPVPNGGTGVATATAHGVVVGEGTSPFNVTAAGTSGQPLVSNGAAADPTYQTLPVSGGGTGFATATANGILYGNTTSPLSVTAPGSQYQTLQAGVTGTPAFGAVALNQAAAVSGILAAANGGTGAASPAAHTVAIAEGASAFAFAGPGSSGQPLVSNGAAADPTYQTLPVSGGGTGVATATAHGVAVGETTSPLNFTGAGTAGQPLVSNGASADPTYQTLPVSGGGTGVTTGTTHGVALGEGTSPLGFTSTGTSGQPLVSNGASVDPAYQTLPVSGGGSGVTTATAHGVLLGEATSPFGVTGAGTSGQPLVSNGAAADPTYQTLPVSGGGTGVATATAHGVALGETTSPLNFTSAGTASQVLTSNGAAADPTFQTVAPGGILPSGTQTQQLRIQPNTGNNTTLQFINRPYVSVADGFAFPSQAPGGSVAVGTNTITLTPCPLGVNGTDTGHYYYIQGGTGTPEPVLGTGGTCTSGAASGTLIFTAAFTHTGAWTIQSATAGGMEAVVFGCAGAVNPDVYFSAGGYQIFQQITIPNLCAPKLRGAGPDNTFLIQNTPSASIINDTCNCDGMKLSDFQYFYNSAANASVNAIVISGGNAGSNQHFQMNNVFCNGITGGMTGFVYNCIQLFNVQYAHIENNNIFQDFANDGIYLTGNASGNGGGDNHFINNTFFSLSTANASIYTDFGGAEVTIALNKFNHGTYCIEFNIPSGSFAGGLRIIGNSLENCGTANIYFFTASSSTTPIFDISVLDNSIDIVPGNNIATWSGVLIDGTSANSVTGVRIQNNRFAGYTPRTTTLAGIQFGGAGVKVDTALISNNEFSVLDYPAFISSASTNISYTKNQTSNAVSNSIQIGTASVIVDPNQSATFALMTTANQYAASANGSRLYCSDCNAFGTAGGGSGQWMIRENGVWIPANFLTPLIYNTNSNSSGAITLTAAQITGASIEVDLGLTGAQASPQNATLPTVAALLAVITNAQNGQTYKLRVINVGTTQTATITTNTGWTLNGTMTVATNTWRDFVLTITSVGSVTATLQSVGTGTQS